MRAVSFVKWHFWCLLPGPALAHPWYSVGVCEELAPGERYRRKRGSRRGGDGQTANALVLRNAALELYSRVLEQVRRQPEGVEALIAAELNPELRTALRHMHDRVAFAREVLGFEPDPEQEPPLRSWAKRLILNCNRQWGKSTIVAIRALHRAWFWPGSLILIVSVTQMHTANLFQKVLEFLPALGVTGRPMTDGVNRKSVKLPNGSRIVALAGGDFPTRSHSRVAMVIIDEASMVPDPVHEAVSPTLGRTNGELVLLSTPRGKRGAFYRAWAFGGDAWERVFGPVNQSSGRISKEHLENERNEKGSEVYAQEYLCEFFDRDSHMFNEDSIQEVFDQDLDNWE